jgi:primosomal replication protein N''
MPPSSFFTSKAEMLPEDEDNDEFSSHDEEILALIKEEKQKILAIKDCEDLLNLAKKMLPSVMLEIHYRSRFRELIDFSNAAFYNGQLNISSYHTTREILEIKPIELININGTYENQTNTKEAERVISELKEIWKKPFEQRPSLGVVTFNQKQADLIEDLIEVETTLDSFFLKSLEEEYNRKDDNEDLSFFVKSVENVQGDERDIIIFSSTFGKDPFGRFYRKFGVLGQQGGERRLNVAITRAKKRVILINSMPIENISDMLDTIKAPSNPRDYIQLYWAYARALTQADRELASKYLYRLNPGKRPSEKNLKNDGLISSVLDYLKSNSFKVVQGTNQDIFSVDFLLEDEQTGRYFLGIDCDTPKHELLKNARNREIWRTNVLLTRLPMVFRLNARDWLIQPEKEKKRLTKAINEALVLERKIA